MPRPRRIRLERTAAWIGVLLTFSASSATPDKDAAALLDDRLARGETVLEFQKVDGYPQSAVLLSVMLEAPPEQVFALVDGCNGYAGLMPRTLSSVEVSRVGDSSVCRWVVDVPFPMKNLSTEVAATSRHTPGLWTREFKQTRGDFRRNEGLWTLTPFRGDPRRTRLEYRLFVAVDAIFPDAFVKLGQRGGMTDMVQSLRARLRSGH
jgi:ribosome-associated toxin RatA of RatAB toxin-antitoxin module